MVREASRSKWVELRLEGQVEFVQVENRTWGILAIGQHAQSHGGAKGEGRSGTTASLGVVRKEYRESYDRLFRGGTSRRKV